MKKLFKVLLITSGILAVTGIGIGLAGFCLGGRYQINRDEVSRSTAWDEDIREVDVDMKAGELVIRYGDYEKPGIDFDESRTKVHANVEDGTLQIEGRGKWGCRGGSVELCLPEKTVLDEVSLAVGAGNIEADRLQADEIRIEVGAGEFYCDGPLKTESLDCEVGVGSICIGLAESRETDLECSAGSINITMAGSAQDYYMTGECTLGELFYDREEWNFDDDIEAGAEWTDRKIDARCAVGDITIGFEE